MHCFFKTKHYLTGKASKAETSILEMPLIADLEAVEKYLDRQSSGPKIDKPILHWREPMSHVWNVQAILHLKNEFLLYAFKNHFLDLIAVFGPQIISIKELEKAFRDIEEVEGHMVSRLEQYRSWLQMTMKQVTSWAVSAPKVKARLKKKQDTLRLQHCRQERKCTVQYLLSFYVLLI